MNNTPIADLTHQITGHVVLPDHADYTALRRSYTKNGSPAVIVVPQTVDDIAAALRCARDHQLMLSVRSGGHGLTGQSTNEGGLVINMSQFNQIDVLDTEQGLVRIGTGAKWGDAAKALSAHGLALSSGDTSSVGVGGLTLGGGIGWMVRKYGLTIDSLVAADIVTGDGRHLHVSADENADLFWALRGGGGNFGVVTAFEFRAQKIQNVVGGLVSYDLAEAHSVLTRWVDVMRTAPEELNSTLILFSGFGPDYPPQVMVYVCYAGEDETQANAAIQPLLELGTVTHQDITRRPYHHMLEDTPGEPEGLQFMGDCGFVKRLDADVIAALTANYGTPGTPMLHIRSLGGAFSHVPADATAFAHRDYEAVFWMTTMLPASLPHEEVNAKRQQAWQPLAGYVSGTYINFLSDAGENSVSIAYPPATYQRLAEVKAAYDPDNLFRNNHNIRPAPKPTTLQG